MLEGGEVEIWVDGTEWHGGQAYAVAERLRCGGLTWEGDALTLRRSTATQGRTSVAVKKVTAKKSAAKKVVKKAPAKKAPAKKAPAKKAPAKKVTQK